MSPEVYQNYIALLEKRKRECLISDKAYKIWLNTLTPFNWGYIIIGVALPAIAGAACFGDVFGKDIWKIAASIILLVSGIVSGLHSHFKCDSHQSECMRLSREYDSLAMKYEDAIADKPSNIDKINHELSVEFSKLKKYTKTTPMQWCFDKAERQLK